MLQDKLAELQKAIAAKREEAKAAWDTFEEKREALKSDDVDITDPESEAVKAADEAMKPYSKAAEELRTLEGQFERIALMVADGGQKTPGADVRRENEIDRLNVDARKAFAQAAVEGEGYKALLKSGALAAGSEQAIGRVELAEPMDREQFKSLLTGTSDAAGGVLNVPQRFPGIFDLPQLPLGIMDLVTVGQTDSNAVEFVRILARTIRAAEVAEASTAADGESGRKPESDLTFEEVLEGVATIAHWIPATRNQLADAAFLRTLVEAELLQGVERRAEEQILQGDGIGPNMTGIVATDGVIEYDETDVADDTKADALHRILTLVTLQGYTPSAYAINPLDWEDIRLSKDENLNYIWGPPSTAGAMQVWGRNVVVTTAVDEGQSVVGEWARALFLVREAARVLVSDSHKDWFTRNLIALLAEARGVLVVPRPQAFGVLTFEGS